MLSKVINAEPKSTQWVDESWMNNYMSGGGNYWMGWGSVFLGGYSLALLFNNTRASTDSITFVVVLVTGLIFLGMGFLSISMARNLANRARVIDFRDDSFRVEFWWCRRRKDIEFGINEVESVELFLKEKGIKGIIELFATLPREPICYQVQVRGQPAFILTGTDEPIHEVAKRFTIKKDGNDSTQ